MAAVMWLVSPHGLLSPSCLIPAHPRIQLRHYLFRKAGLPAFICDKGIRLYVITFIDSAFLPTLVSCLFSSIPASLVT